MPTFNTSHYLDKKKYQGNRFLKTPGSRRVDSKPPSVKRRPRTGNCTPYTNVTKLENSNKTLRKPLGRRGRNKGTSGASYTSLNK